MENIKIIIQKVIMCFVIGYAVFYLPHKMFYDYIISSQGAVWLNYIFIVVNPVYFAFSGFMLGDNCIKCSFFPILMSAVFIWSLKVLYFTYEGYIYVPLYILVCYIFMFIRKCMQKHIIKRRNNKRKRYFNEDGEEIFD